MASFFLYTTKQNRWAGSRKRAVYELFYYLYRYYFLSRKLNSVKNNSNWSRNRGARPHHSEKKGASTLFGPPTFHGSPLSALPSVYQFISCHTLGSTALALVCVRGHFRVLENEKFSTLCEGETPSTPSPTRSLRSLICMVPLLYMFLRL